MLRKAPATTSAVHQKSQPKTTKGPTEPPRQPRAPLEPSDVVDIGTLCTRKWGWEGTLKDGQLDAIRAQLQGRDVLVHAATGYGKTCIAAGPHAHPKAAGLVTIMVSPLIALQNEMVDAFRDEYKLTAIAVNSSHGGCTPGVLDVRNTRQLFAHGLTSLGSYQIVLISPELLLTKQFIDRILRDASFTLRILAVVVDEAHVISHWGADFRKMYGLLGMIRAFLPRYASVVAMSATLSGRVRNDVLSKLQFGRDFLDVDVGNDRPNVSLVVRAIEHPLNSYRDLDFIIPTSTKKPEDIPLTWIYADNITIGIEIENHLSTLLPENLRHVGLIRPYNAAQSKEYRDEAMRLFKEGKIRILICTDAAGMGCNIPNIARVVQWKLPPSLSSLLQRAGRAVRKAELQGLAVLLVEPSAYEIDLWGEDSSEQQAKKKRGKGGKAAAVKSKASTRTSVQKKAYAQARGALRGSTKKTDTLTTHEQPPIDLELANEGLIGFVQTTLCRRLVLKEVYNNKQASQCTGPCCDICNPELLDQTRPGVYKARTRRSGAKKGEPSAMVQEKLVEWRTSIKRRDFKTALWSAEGILPLETIVLLSSVGPISDAKILERVLAGQWKWMERYGEELLAFLNSFEMPALTPLPKKKRKAGAST
ncbi:P-loop containing nucleoside triphosphate hydrolase protein, partial [Mycena amicta]